MENNKNMIWWVLIVLAVIGGLVYITINNKSENTAEEIAEDLREDANEDSADTVVVEEKVVENTTENKVENTTTQNGLKITILKEGTGSVAKTGDTVAMNYTGKLSNGTVFDSNVDPKFGHVQPFAFTLGAGEVIAGWDLGIVGMKEGEKRILEISPELGYGDRGAGQAIPPGATLIFEVELLAIKK